MLEDLERRVKGAKSALGKASATLKEQKRAAQVSFVFEHEPDVVIGRKCVDCTRGSQGSVGAVLLTGE